MDPLFAYDANYLIDNRCGIILDAEGTRANRSDEMAIAETMVARVERRFALRPERLAGDTAYGAAKLLKWLWDRGITPHVPVWDKSARPDGKFSRANFAFDKERNVYVCPAGAELTHSGVVDQGRILPYRASTNDCSICKLKPRCTTAVARKVSRDIDEDVRDHVRALANTEAFQLSCRERKKVEVRFAHMKRILKLDRLRLRGLSGVRDEVLLTATAQNLRRLAKFICRGPPRTSECPLASSVGAMRSRLQATRPTAETPTRCGPGGRTRSSAGELKLIRRPSMRTARRRPSTRPERPSTRPHPGRRERSTSTGSPERGTKTRRAM